MSSFLNPTFLLAMLLALSVHEAAHAYAAYKLGDHTAKLAGRLTLNPLAHLDPMGTILFLIVGFGWGKPVPVNPYYFKHPKRDSAITAFAGPLSNFLLAIASLLLLKLSAGSLASSSAFSLLDAGTGDANIFLAFLHSFLAAFVFLNLGLMAFNLIPIAPLDGSKILALFIPPRFEDDYDRFMEYGPYVLLALLIGENILHVSILSWWIQSVMGGVLSLFSAVFGG